MPCNFGRPCVAGEWPAARPGTVQIVGVVCWYGMCSHVSLWCVGMI